MIVSFDDQKPLYLHHPFLSGTVQERNSDIYHSYYFQSFNL